jgi:hypothetical protein
MSAYDPKRTKRDWGTIAFERQNRHEKLSETGSIIYGQSIDLGLREF